MALWEVYYTATHLDDALRLLHKHAEQARVVAGGTDLLVELRNHVRKAPVLIDVTRMGKLDTIKMGEDACIHVGPMVTHAQAAASPLLQEQALPLAQACWWVGSPALRNRGTIAGNIVTASPANDTITALRALEAKITLSSVRGTRVVPLAEFHTGVRRTIMAPDEMVTDIAFAPLTGRKKGVYLKLGLRRVVTIAVVNVAVVIETTGNGTVTEARISLGSVAPTIIRAPKAEAFLVGGPLSDERVMEAARLASEAARPIDDVRGTAWFRNEEVASLTQRCLESLREGQERLGLPVPEHMVKLWGRTCRWPHLSGPTIAHYVKGDEPIQCVVNGKTVTVQGANGKTLLHMLRDDLGLTGAKPGCEEGECGACTIWLDGITTLACLTPAPRAHSARITTVEGLSAGESLHPVQEAFIEEDAVQCGYCTPGFIMSAAKLLEEVPHPSREQIKTALSGNICRCTGYYKIVKAVENAASKSR